MTANDAVWLLLAHGIGDYVLQSHWMAVEKVKRWRPAIIHAVLYGVPFVALVPSVWAWSVIVGTHAVIDRYRLARYLVWCKNLLAPRGHRPRWRDCDPETGFPVGVPGWLATWLMFIVDNMVHVTINAVAAIYL